MNLFRFAACWLPWVGLTTLLCAQDATVGPFSWLNPHDHPDELPAPKYSVHVEFPRELRDTPDIGYVVFERPVSEKGRIMAGRVNGTLTAYLEAAEQALESRIYTPGRKGGKPVISYVHQSVVFNPASAAEGKPDATPRLLDAYWVDISVNQDDHRFDRNVWCTLSLDAAGQVTGVKDAPAEFADAITQTVRRWKFAPARRAGQPIAAAVRVPCILRFIHDKKVYDTPPRATRRVPPEYPESMRRSGLRANVTVYFTIDREGRVKNAFVARSLNHAFDQPALEAMKRWRFEPARLKGEPVESKFAQTFDFRLDAAGGGDDGITLRGHMDVSKLPPGLRYDVAPKILGWTLPVYPYQWLSADRKGAATVALMIDENGRVTATHIQAASAPEFGLALQAAADATDFQPALRAGHPTKTVTAIGWDFTTVEADHLVKPRDVDLLRLERKHPENLASADQLDEALDPVVSPDPKYPTGATGKVEQPSAEIEFLIDTDGTVHLARIAKATQEVFGYAAVQAVASWQYNPPTVHGKPVVVRARHSFEFDASGHKEE